MSTKHSKGFTLVEFIIILAIIGTVAAIAIPNIKRAMKNKEYREHHNGQNPPVTKVVIPDGKIEVVTIEGCEYFYQRTYYGYHVLTHKGNCKNPIHKYEINSNYVEASQ
jgi:prepilin-type N-terminal cleavage/methylation domain-containing protein